MSFTYDAAGATQSETQPIGGYGYTLILGRTELGHLQAVDDPPGNRICDFRAVAAPGAAAVTGGAGRPRRHA